MEILKTLAIRKGRYQAIFHSVKNLVRKHNAWPMRSPQHHFTNTTFGKFLLLK